MSTRSTGVALAALILTLAGCSSSSDACTDSVCRRTQSDGAVDQGSGDASVTGPEPHVAPPRNTPSTMDVARRLEGGTPIGDSIRDAAQPEDAGDETSDAGADAAPVERDAGPFDSGADAEPVDEDSGVQPPGPSGICDVPHVDPPRAAAVGKDERTCANSEEAWPGCIADACDAPDFEAACKQRCEMTCERERWFCSGSRCGTPDTAAAYCASAEAVAECVDTCGDDPNCLNAACASARDAACGDLACPASTSPVCEGLLCSNSCDTANDGICQDGSAINAQAATCALGTDCADCGAREPAPFALYEECRSTVQCDGGTSGEAWCINVSIDPAISLGRCVPDCDGDGGRECPGGYACLSLQRGGSACFPQCFISNQS